MPPPSQTLAGKVALITGAGRGIGAAIARAYAGAGASVSCAARTREQVQATAAAITSTGGQALACAADIPSETAVQAMLEQTVQRFGGLDILVLNAGVDLDPGLPETAAYACSKAGLWMLTRILAQELITENISVNELIPGPVQTAIAPDGPAQGILASFPHEWRKRPDDIVPLALFLATQPERGPTAQSFRLMRRDG